MAERKIVWSGIAEQDLRDILEYFNERNRSNLYSIKLLILITKSIENIAAIPHLEISCTNASTRILIVESYMIVYDFSESSINILNIWDTRQDPQKAPFRKV